MQKLMPNLIADFSRDSKHAIRSPSVAFAALILFIAGCASNTPAPVVEGRPATTTATPAVPARPSTPPAGVPTVATTPSTTPTPQRPTIATPAPVTTTAPAGKTHTVQRGETLFGIAFQNGVDLRELALWNNIENPALIKVGDVIRLTPPAGLAPTPTAPTVPASTQPTPPTANSATSTLPVSPATSERPPQNTTVMKVEPRAGKVPYSDQAMARANNEPLPASSSTTSTPTSSVPPAATGVPSITLPPTAGTVPATPTAPSATTTSATTTSQAPAPATSAATPAATNIDWQWPVKGSVMTMFTELNKGIDIAGTRGTAVLAAAPGTVIHTGAGIRGYGRLVIVKHANNFVSAYAHNDKIVVNEGQEVKRGQKIAEMGNSDAEQVKLHFEIRRQGKPIDPLTVLPRP
jgi:lipoprotein NlpD